MTEQENKAIKWMKNVRDDAVATLDHIAKEEPNVSPMLYAGRKEKAETIIKGFEELEQYRAIGTPDECRAAVEKQKAKKPVEMKPTDKLLNGYFVCPICGGLVGMDEYSNKYCGCCGQKLDWGDENDD
mgnify:CR=1 FL=1